MDPVTMDEWWKEAYSIAKNLDNRKLSTPLTGSIEVEESDSDESVNDENVEAEEQGKNEEEKVVDGNEDNGGRGSDEEDHSLNESDDEEYDAEAEKGNSADAFQTKKTTVKRVVERPKKLKEVQIEKGGKSLSLKYKSLNTRNIPKIFVATM